MAKYVNPIYKRSLKYLERGHDTKNKTFYKRGPEDLKRFEKFEDYRDFKTGRTEKTRIILDDD